jgi:N-glycosylase/DNA lyase
MLLALKIIGGIAKRVGIISYSNGTVVERTYPIDSDIPEDVRIVTSPAKQINSKPYNPHVHEHIHNQEYLQYAFHFSGQ